HLKLLETGEYADVIIYTGQEPDNEEFYQDQHILKTQMIGQKPKEI
ncbi:13597_t:CDS:1, partial [Funneliformis geosporum]